MYATHDIMQKKTIFGKYFVFIFIVSENVGSVCELKKIIIGEKYFFLTLIAFLAIIAIASAGLCSRDEKGPMAKYEKSNSNVQPVVPPKPAVPEVPDTFQVIKNGKAVNKPHVAQRSKVTGRIEWTEK